MNSVCLVGRLTKDPELKVTGNGLNKTDFTVAVQRDYKNVNGGYDTDFIRCTAWRQQVEMICKYFKKGSQIGITGKIQTRSWENESGQKMFATDIMVSSVTFCSKANDTSQAQNGTYQTANAEPNHNDFMEFEVAEDDDLPF